MPREDPFAGIRLSEQATPKIEQRLFAAEPTPVLTSKPAPSSKPTEELLAAKEGARTPRSAVANPEMPERNTGPGVPRRPTPARQSPQFDLKELPIYKASFLFTVEELEVLEDLKLELRREYDTKITKNELIRCALHLLAEDHRAKPEQSYVFRKIRERRPTQSDKPTRDVVPADENLDRRR